MKKSNVMNAILLSLVAMSMVACGGSSKSSQKKAGPEAPVVEPAGEESAEKVTEDKEYQHPAYTASKKDSRVKVISLNNTIRIAHKLIQEEQAKIDAIKSEGMAEYRASAEQVQKHKDFIEEQENDIKEATRHRDMYSTRIHVLNAEESFFNAKKSLKQAHTEALEKDSERAMVAAKTEIALLTAKMEKIENPVAFLRKMEEKLGNLKKELVKVQKTEKRDSEKELQLESDIGEMQVRIDSLKADIGE